MTLVRLFFFLKRLFDARSEAIIEGMRGGSEPIAAPTAEATADQ